MVTPTTPTEHRVSPEEQQHGLVEVHTRQQISDGILQTAQSAIQALTQHITQMGQQIAQMGQQIVQLTNMYNNVDVDNRDLRQKLDFVSNILANAASGAATPAGQKSKLDYARAKGL